MNNDSLTRIPQALTFDTSAISRNFGDSAGIIRDILVFLANKTTNSFFHEFTFTLDEFCDEFGYRKVELQRTLPEFRECPKEKLPVEGGHVFDGVFEYALYLGFTRAIIFKVNNLKGNGFDLRNLLLFSRIRAVYKNVGKRNEKRHYLVELDYRVKQMQLSRYFLTDKNQYTKIQVPMKQKLTGGLRNFYLYIGRMISLVKLGCKEGKEPIYTLTVDEIADIMELAISDNRYRKQKVKAYLDDISNVLGNYGYTYKFFKGEGQSYEYSVMFHFTEETLNYFDEQKKAQFFTALYNGVEFEYYRNNNDGKIRFLDWRREIDAIDEMNIYKWLFDNNIDVWRYFTTKFEEIYGIKYDGRFGDVNDEL